LTKFPARFETHIGAAREELPEKILSGSRLGH
jgi:hypothetical protein